MTENRRERDVGVRRTPSLVQRLARLRETDRTAYFTLLGALVRARRARRR